MKTAIIIPAMRPSIVNVIEDLERQTVKPDYVLVVNNSGMNVEFPNTSFKLSISTPNYNLGTNAVWNLIFSEALEDFDYIGICGDDYRIHRKCLEVLQKALHTNYHPFKIGISTSMICKEVNRFNQFQHVFDDKNFTAVPVIGKGHMGFALLQKSFIDCLPEIPKEFNIFFGDNWIGWWVEKLGYKIMQVSCGICHSKSNDLKILLDYPKVIEGERIIWKTWLRGEIEL